MRVTKTSHCSVLHARRKKFRTPKCSAAASLDLMHVELRAARDRGTSRLVSQTQRAFPLAVATITRELRSVSRRRLNDGAKLPVVTTRQHPLRSAAAEQCAEADQPRRPLSEGRASC